MWQAHVQAARLNPGDDDSIVICGVHADSAVLFIAPVHDAPVDVMAIGIMGCIDLQYFASNGRQCIVSNMLKSCG